MTTGLTDWLACWLSLHSCVHISHVGNARLGIRVIIILRILPAYQSNISKTSPRPAPHLPTPASEHPIVDRSQSGVLTILALLFSCFSSFPSEILADWRSVSLKSSPEIWALLALLSCIRVFQSRPICRVFCLSQNRSMAVQENCGSGWTPPPPPVSHNKIFKFSARITRL